MGSIGYRGYNDEAVIYIMHDECGENPRTAYDKLGTMVLFGRSAGYGDEHGYKNPTDFLYGLAEELGASSDWIYNSLNKVWDYILKRVIILPVHKYEHGNVALRTSAAFSCPWDSGQVGWIYITKEEARKEYGRLTEQNIEKAKSYMRNEVELQTQYINGDCYGYVYRTRNGEEESCWGFYGTDWKTNGIADYIPEEHQDILDDMEYGHDWDSNKDPEEWDDLTDTTEEDEEGDDYTMIKKEVTVNLFDGREVAELISSFVNSSVTDKKAFVERLANDHPTLQQSTMRLFMQFVKAMAEKPYYDGRNEQAGRMARAVVEATKEMGLPLV